MKKLLVLFGVCLLAFPSVSRATMEMDIGMAFNSFGENRAEGQGRAITILFDMSDSMRAGYSSEQVDNLTLKNAGVTYPGSVSIETMMMLLKMGELDKVSCSLGIGIGSADINIPAAGLFVGAVESVPVMDLLGRFDYSPRDYKGAGVISIGIGYRFMDITDVATPFGGTTKTLDDLSGILIRFNTGIKF